MLRLTGLTLLSSGLPDGVSLEGLVPFLRVMKYHRQNFASSSLLLLHSSYTSLSDKTLSLTHTSFAARHQLRCLSKCFACFFFESVVLVIFLDFSLQDLETFCLGSKVLFASLDQQSLNPLAFPPEVGSYQLLDENLVCQPSQFVSKRTSKTFHHVSPFLL